MQSQVKFNRVPEKVPEKLEGFGAEPGQVQQGSGKGSEGSGAGLGGFSAEPGQVQQRSGESSGEGSGEGLGGFGAEPGQVQHGSGEGLGCFGAEPSQVQQGSGEGSGEGVGGFGAEPGQGSREGSGEGSGRLWCRARSVQQGSGEGLGGFGAEPGQVQQVLRPFNLIHGKPAEVFPALGFAARFRKICKNKTLRLLGIPPKFFVVVYVLLICC